MNEYLTYAADLRFIDKMHVKKAVAEAMDKTGISHFSSRLIRNLSGGYKQRVGIAQAIIHKPNMVMLDEPTNGLDPNQIIEARKLIREIGGDHIVLLSSHVLSEINLLCRDYHDRRRPHRVLRYDGFIQQLSAACQRDRSGWRTTPGETELIGIPGTTKVEFLTARQGRFCFIEGSTIPSRNTS